MDERAILRRVRRWVRARNGLRAGLVAVALVLGAALAGRLLGRSLPTVVWLAVPALAAVGWGWPLPWERLLLQVGRKLGVGERLAALDVVIERGSSPLAGPLCAEIVAAHPRGWRLLAGPVEYGASALVVALAVAVGFASPLGPSGAPPQAAAPAAEEVVGTVPPPDEAAGEAPPPVMESPAVYPAQAEIPAYSPYHDLLASILGLEDALTGGLSGDEVAARLAQEEGLLRQLAERIAAAAPGGLSPSERAELAPLARQVARPDLRERLSELLDQGGEAPAREAEEAVAAVLAAADRASEDGEDKSAGALSSAPAAGAGSGTTTGGSAEGKKTVEGPLAPRDAELDGSDPFAGGEEGADFPGTVGGGPLESGPTGDWAPTPGEEQPNVVVGGEGEMRAYIVPGIPGEPSPSAGNAPPALAPQDVEVVLRARGIPPELRSLVRRYFELIGGNP